MSSEAPLLKPLDLSADTPHPSASGAHLLPQGQKGHTRRLLLAAPFALAACDRFASAEPAPQPAPSLKAMAPCPVGTCVMTGQLRDPRWVDLASFHVSQLTPEWEMKMEYILGGAPGRLRFDAPDRIVAFARDHGMAVHGHALIWYSQGEAFAQLDRAAFDQAFDGYIAAVAGRYRGHVRSWDVVNEPVLNDGSGLRDCHWSARYGHEGYIRRAFEQAKLADPDAVLFLNEYNLENTPAKGTAFLRLVERLLRAGVPIGGIGTQSHLDIEIPHGQAAAFIREAGRFGLPVHVSELDASLRSERRIDLRSPDERRRQQSAVVGELAEAFMALPDAQRFAFTVWGLRDIDSFLRRGQMDDGRDNPVLLDSQGGPTPVFEAVAQAFRSA